MEAEDREGRPLHPTLHALWEAVDSSGHSLFVEIPDSKDTPSYLAGRFEVTRVDPEGRAHEGRLILNLRVIDRASTQAGAARADGFIPFAGLGREERYTEVVAHELAHAAWHFADPERASLGARLQGELEELVERRSAARAWGREEPRRGLAQALELALDLEGVAEVAERAVWKELRSGQGRRSLSTRKGTSCALAEVTAGHRGRCILPSLHSHTSLTHDCRLGAGRDAVARGVEP